MCRRRSSTPWRCWPGRWGSGTWRAGRSCAPVITPTRWWRPMRTEVVLPDLQAGPAVLSVWFADVGELVYEGDRLVEVLVGGATFDVAAPATGRLAEKWVLVNDPLQPGQVLGVVETSSESD